jgi:hypothetical protein
MHNLTGNLLSKTDKAILTPLPKDLSPG